MTVALVIVQEMSARLGATTGRGLVSLVREQFSLRLTTFCVLCLLVANLGLVVSELAGVGVAMEMLGVTRYLSVPLAAAGVWAVVMFGSYRYAERVFVLLSLVFLAYPIAAILGHPDWTEVASNTFVPHLVASKGFLVLTVALIGTTITPYMNPADLLRAVRQITLDANVVAIDVVEVAPPYDWADTTTNNAHRVVMEFLAGFADKRRRALQ